MAEKRKTEGYRSLSNLGDAFYNVVKKRGHSILDARARVSRARNDHLKELSEASKDIESHYPAVPFR